tara:strand:- start:1780 stop:2013 length:234 start_codon:yes stop_codon:yes gene_type:complete
MISIDDDEQQKKRERRKKKPTQKPFKFIAQTFIIIISTQPLSPHTNTSTTRKKKGLAELSASTHTISPTVLKRSFYL